VLLFFLLCLSSPPIAAFAPRLFARDTSDNHPPPLSPYPWIRDPTLCNSLLAVALNRRCPSRRAFFRVRHSLSFI
jgi:hypothetical protein